MVVAFWYTAISTSAKWYKSFLYNGVFVGQPEKLQTHLFENAQKRTIYLTKRPCKKKCGCFACKFKKMVFVK